ncbi:MAG: hypothetical protein U0T36_10080 [Saprospiraceae bacterium]
MINKLFIMLILSFISCNSNTVKSISKLKFENYEFKLNGFEWEGNPYNFSAYIRDTVFPSDGPQKAACEFSYIGDIENLHKYWDSQSSKKGTLSQKQIDSFALFNASNAIDYILKMSKDYQVVIINEGHHIPQHRVFTTHLLDGLKKQGFKHLGLETYLANEKNDSLLQVNGYPTLKTGYYTKEPQFGNLVRVAHNKGFKVFGYESEGHTDGKEREINQAKNIKAYMDKYPNEKILIHCGFDHGLEGELGGNWEKAMAGRLTEFTGIDPLTINQVKYSEKSSRQLENPFYQLTDLDEPSVFINQDGKVFGEYKKGEWFDITIFHPRSKKYNRPVWMTYGERQEVDIEFKDTEIDCPCLVFAYKAGEEIGAAVPYDIQETNDKIVKMVLDKSDFEIVVWNEKGKAMKSQIKNKKR